MTDRDISGSMDPMESPGGDLSPQGRPPERERTYRSPLLFDLTLLQEDQEENRTPPTVYYLAALVPSASATSAWRTAAGFGGVILAGVGLGLLLAVLLL